MSDRRTSTQDDAKVTSDVIDAIANNLEVDQVFDQDVIVDYVKANLSPEGVFGRSALEEWARENGWEPAP